MIAEDTKLLPKRVFCRLSVSVARGEEGVAWVDGVAEVMCYGQCSASGGSVNEGWQFGRGEANYF